jgi:hypothetical protein
VKVKVEMLDQRESQPATALATQPSQRLMKDEDPKADHSKMLDVVKKLDYSSLEFFCVSPPNQSAL